MATIKKPPVTTSEEISTTVFLRLPSEQELRGGQAVRSAHVLPWPEAETAAME
jgi:hypothetical protein